MAEAKLILDSTSDTVAVVTGSAVNTIHVHTSWVDITTTALTPGSANTLITLGAPTTTTVVASPGASTQRQVKLITVYNSHASSSNAISIQHYDGTNTAVLIKYTLLAGETLQWSEDENFRVIDASGQIKAAVAADTEMPAASAPSAASAAPTAPAVYAYIWCQDFGAATYSACQASPNIAHDAAASTVPPLLMGGYASATAPADVSTTLDAVRSWHLLNGQQVVQQAFSGVLATTGAGNTGTGVQRVIEATDSQLSAGVGATGDAAATAGSTGSINAKLRLLTTDIDAIKTAIQLLDNAVSGSGYNITQMNGVNVSMNSGAHGTGTQRVSVAGPCADPARITHAAISESTAATNEIVALNGSDLIYVCSYKWVTTAANSLNWTRGTGTDCATGPAAIEGAQPFAANGGVVESGGGHPLFVVPAGNALCLVSSAATAHGGRVSYVRTATP
jgi:hypothetical protein